MNRQITKIVISGGPCTGKTTVNELILIEIEMEFGTQIPCL